MRGRCPAPLREDRQRASSSFPVNELMNQKVLHKYSITDLAWSPLTTVVGDETLKTVFEPMGSDH